MKVLLLLFLVNVEMKNLSEYKTNRLIDNQKLSSRNFRLVFDFSFLVENFTQEKKQLKKIFKLFKNVSDFFGNYFTYFSDHREIITIPKDYIDCEFRLENKDIFQRNSFFKEQEFLADLLIFVTGVDLQGHIIAQAGPCSIDSQNNSLVGKMILNIKNFNFNFENPYYYNNAYKIIIHEVLHIMSFHYQFTQKLNMLKNIGQFKNLFKLINSELGSKSDKLKSGSHWSLLYNPLDLMNPYERLDSIFTVYTKEFIEFVSDNKIRIQDIFESNKLVLNYQENFLRIQKLNCKNDNQFFCSKEQENQYFCSNDYQTKLKCHKDLLNNGCYPKVPIFNGDCGNEEIKGDFVEYFGSDSRCWRGSKKALCLKTQIKENKIFLNVDGKQFQCEFDYQRIKIKDQFIKCPKIEHFLSNFDHCPQNCNFNGLCLNKKCICFKGFKGKICEGQLKSTKEFFTLAYMQTVTNIQLIQQ